MAALKHMSEIILLMRRNLLAYSLIISNLADSEVCIYSDHRQNVPW